jgi:hypothetical protein
LGNWGCPSVGALIGVGLAYLYQKVVRIYYVIFTIILKIYYNFNFGKYEIVNWDVVSDFERVI